jgi:hypothetical protein
MNPYSLKHSLVLAALILGVSLGFTGLEAANVVSSDFADRGRGVALGLVLIIYGSAAPKYLPPITRIEDAARKQSVQRFAGWTFVIAGIGYSLAFLVLPLDIAAYGAVGCGVAGLLIVAARCISARTIP